MSPNILFKLLVEKAVQTYFKLLFYQPFWFWVLNRKSRRLFRDHRPELNKVQERILRELDETGIAVTRLEEFFPDEPKLKELLEAKPPSGGLASSEKDETKTKKTFLRFLWEVRPKLEFQNPFLRLALERKVLDVVNSYFKMFSRFYFFTLNITRPVARGSEETASQRWHRDPEDKKIVKIFLYLSDVDENSGPFIYVPYSTTKFAHISPQKPPRGSYPKEMNLPYQIYTGQAGTLIFCDTTGLHKGGHALSRERIMFTAGYYSSASPFRELFELSPELLENFKGPSRFALEKNSTRFSSYILYKFKDFFRKKK